MTGVRWVADFRDPWTDAVFTRPFECQCALGNYLQKWLERCVIKSADVVLTTTRQLKEIFQERYSEEPADKFVYMPNGYEIAKDSCSEQEKDETFTMTYTGNLYGGRTPEPIFSAVATLISGGLIGRQEIRIRLVGDCQSINGVDTGKIAQLYGLDEIVEVMGRVPHAEALRYNQRSHLLLLIAASQHYFCVPAKAYEYLASRIPILALTGKGATRDLIEETDAGVCFSDSDVDGIARFILERFQAARTSAPSRNSEKARQYEMEALAGKLDQVLSALIRNNCVGER
jgi:glycosyltransferase involved in cell wall biosynthesis